MTKPIFFIMVAKATIFFLTLVAFVGASPAPALIDASAKDGIAARMSHPVSALPSLHVSYRTGDAILRVPGAPGDLLGA